MTDGGHYHIETSSPLCCANQWAGVFTIGSSVMIQLRVNAFLFLSYIKTGFAIFTQVKDIAQKIEVFHKGLLKELLPNLQLLRIWSHLLKKILNKKVSYFVQLEPAHPVHFTKSVDNVSE